MMIASPTAASAAATVITNTTKTCPVAPYTRENATKVRFTAFSISSTHMKIMIALRRVRTPTTPIVKSAAESASDSASTAVSLAAEDYSARDSNQQQNARELEREQVFIEQRSGDCAHRSQLFHLISREVGRHHIGRRHLAAAHHHDLGYHYNPDPNGKQSCPK